MKSVLVAGASHTNPILNALWGPLAASNPSGACHAVRIPRMMPKFFSDPDALAEEIIRDVGTELVVGLPLGLGKANHVVNALYARACADPDIKLTLLSALTLEKPRPKRLIEHRFITPVIDRLFGGYPDLAYAVALREGRLPPISTSSSSSSLPAAGCTCRPRSRTTSRPTPRTPLATCWHASST